MHTMSESLVTGEALLGLLRRRGDELNGVCERCVAATGAHLRRPLLDRLHGRSTTWPEAPKALRMELARIWTQIGLEIHKYAKGLAEGQRAANGSLDDYSGYLTRVVLARVTLEDTTDPSALAVEVVRPWQHSQLLTAADAPTLVSAGDVARLEADGFVLLRTRLDPRLAREFALLHRHGVISPTNSSCNPGAHGVMLRCGTAEEREQFVRQGTPALLGAIELLRAMPYQLLRAGYRYRPPPPSESHQHAMPSESHQHARPSVTAAAVSAGSSAPSAAQSGACAQDGAGAALRLQVPQYIPQYIPQYPAD